MKNNKTNIAIFDFCGTMVPFQSADEFIRFSTFDYANRAKAKKTDSIIAFLRKIRFLSLYNKLFKESLEKKIIAKRIKGMSVVEATSLAKRFVEKKIKPSFIKETLTILNDCKKNNYYIVFVSAAYDIYLSILAAELGFDFVIATKLDSKNGVMTGRFKNDCVGLRKKKMIMRHLNQRFGEGNYDIVLSIGDSKTDIPVLDLALKKIVVSKSHQAWIKPSYEEIIYGD